MLSDQRTQNGIEIAAGKRQSLFQICQQHRHLRKMPARDAQHAERKIGAEDFAAGALQRRKVASGAATGIENSLPFFGRQRD